LFVKVVELVGESHNSWKDAVRAAIHEASKSVSHISGVEVMNFTANVQGGEVVEYKANVKIAYTDDKANPSLS
jgi:flavin-binding protein dodecin